MKQIFVLCSIIAFTGAIINMIVTVSGEKNFSKAISSLLGIILLLTFFKTFSNDDLSKITFSINPEENTQLNKGTIEKAIKISENEIIELIKSAIEKQFYTSPKNISIKINSETLKIESTVIVLARTDILISTFELKDFLKSKFQIEAEVYFT